MGQNTLQTSMDQQNPPYIVVYERPGDDKIVAQDVTITTPHGRILVNKLNAEIPLGSRVAIIGENGTGKTTTAKAFTGNYDFGSGIVGVPSGIKENSMIMSQEVFLPSVTLRAILNKTPDENPVFEDEELTRILQLVGHDRLIQHIPGQQTNLLVEDLLKHAKSLAEENPDTDKAILDLSLEAEKLVGEQFEVVQYMTDNSRKKLLEGLKDIPSFEKNAQSMADELTDVIDHALLEPLRKQMAKVIEYEAYARRGKIISYAPWQASYYAGVFAENFRDRINEYLRNEDTDNKLRPILINASQRDMIVAESIPMMRDAFKRNAKSNAITQFFNIVSAPLSFLMGMRLRAAASAKNARNALAFFMNTQVKNGSDFRRQLSGGEKQRLIFAKALLHKPALLIADEPTASLDHPTGEKMYEILMQEMPKTSTIVSIVHDLDKIRHHDTLGELENLTLTFSKIDENTVDRLRQKVIDKHQKAIESGAAFTLD